jgi:drug/metabolite transporter (DMT)-like permease
MKNYPTLQLYIAVFLLGFTGLLGRVIDLPVPVIICLRGAIAAVFLGAVLKYKKSQLKLPFNKDLLYILLLGLIVAMHWVIYFWSIKVANVAVAMISLYTYPVMTVLLEPFFIKEKRYFSDILAALLVLVGISLINTEISWSNNVFRGSILGLIAAVLFAFRGIISRMLIMKNYKGETMMFYQLVVAFLVLSPTLFIMNYHLHKLSIFYLLLLGVFCTAVGHTLWVRSLLFFKASTTGIISCLAPVIGTAAAWIILGEKISLRIFLGAGLILMTVGYETLRHAKELEKD